MKKTLFLLATSLSTLVIAPKLKAQAPILEKSFEVSRKARKGDLTAIDFDADKGTIDLIYILPDRLFTGNKIHSEIYTYSKDLDFIESNKIDIPLTRIRKGKVREDITYTTVDATPGFAIPMKIVFKKKEVARRFNWLTLRYEVSEKVLERIVPKTGEDDKYTWGNKYDVPQDKAVLIVSGKHKKKTANMAMYYDILRCDIDANVTVTDSINFTRPFLSIFSGPLQDDNEADEIDLTRDWIIVYAPTKNKTFPEVKTNEFTYVRISPKGKVLERFTFESPANHWQINSAFQKNGSVYLSGAALTKDKDKKYHSELYKGKMQYTNLQICKITNKKIDFISSPSLTDFANKQAQPANQKKPIVFDGKSLITNPLVFADNGDILLTCQDGLEKKYTTAYMFDFDANGVFKKYYNVSVKSDGKISSQTTSLYAQPKVNYFIPSTDGKNTYWLIQAVKQSQCISTTVKDVKTTTCYPKEGIDLCTINNATGEISEVKTLAREKKDEYYMFENAAYPVKMGNYIFMAGENLKGSKIMLTRLDISK